jgi:hypothetical protein
MKKKLVITINKEKLPLDQCRYVDGAYYKIGDITIKDSGDCYLINGKFYREETGKIVYDYRINQYVIRNMNIIKGVIGFDENNVPILGNFSLTGSEVILNTPTERLFVIDEKIIIDNQEYREKISNGEYYHISLLSSKDFIVKEIPSNEYKTSLPYDSKGITEDFIKDYDNLELRINPKLESYAEILKGLSFGFEFETIKGFIPDRVLKKIGLIPLRDGSISGIEYVSVPMTGGKGLHVLMEAIKELNKRTEYDNSCALHLHLGNIPRTKEFILAFFLVTLKYQEEIFSMFPLYKKYNFGVKRKNYSQPYNLFQFLSKIDSSIDQNNLNKNFKCLFDYLNQDYYPLEEIKGDLNLVEYHPADKEGNQKWNIKYRYHFHNFIPLIYGNKQTIEFRIHTPTYDVNKILSFLFLNASLINFTKRHEREILKNPGKFLLNYKNLSHVYCEEFDTVGNRIMREQLKDFLSNTIHYRKDYIAKISAQGDIVGDEKKCRTGGGRIKWFDLLKEEFKEGIDLDLLRELFQNKERQIIEEHKKGLLSLDLASKRLNAIKLKYSNYSKSVSLGETVTEEDLINW